MKKSAQLPLPQPLAARSAQIDPAGPPARAACRGHGADANSPRIGRHIVEFGQQGEVRAAYGNKLLPSLADSLTGEFRKDFNATNLRHMRGFYLAFPIHDALSHELSWIHYRNLLRVKNDAARQWYMKEVATQNWSSREQLQKIQQQAEIAGLIVGEGNFVCPQCGAVMAGEFFV